MLASGLRPGGYMAFKLRLRLEIALIPALMIGLVWCIVSRELLYTLLSNQGLTLIFDRGLPRRRLERRRTLMAIRTSMSGVEYLCGA